jgi:hypothetical protein
MSGTVTACAAVYICAGQTAHRARGTQLLPIGDKPLVWSQSVQLVADMLHYKHDESQAEQVTAPVS